MKIEIGWKWFYRSMHWSNFTFIIEFVYLKKKNIEIKIEMG